MCTWRKVINKGFLTKCAWADGQFGLCKVISENQSGFRNDPCFSVEPQVPSFGDGPS